MLFRELRLGSRIVPEVTTGGARCSYRVVAGRIGLDRCLRCGVRILRVHLERACLATVKWSEIDQSRGQRS